MDGNNIYENDAMDGFEGELVTIEDEDGNEFELEHIDSLEYDGEDYSLFLPANTDPDDPDYGFIILREEYDGGTQELAYNSVDDEELLVKVYDLFMERLYSDEEGEDTDEGGAE